MSNTSTRRLRAGALLALGALFAASAGPVAAVDDTPPTGGVELWDISAQKQTFELKVTFADPESGIDHLDIQCDDLPIVSRPMATFITISFFDTAAGGCTTYGHHWIHLVAWNGDGLAADAYENVTFGRAVHLTVSPNPTTGHPITITPVYPDDYTLPSDATCEWEVRWGNERALYHNDFNETFGSIHMAGPKGKGFCGPWTFTLPWVPVPQFQVFWSMESDIDEIAGDTIGGHGPGGLLHADVDSTDPHIDHSNVPMAYLLPEAYIATVGEPITYRIYTLGGADIQGDDSWVAGFEGGEHSIVKAGGRTFTFTPDRVGNWVVFWNSGPGKNYQLGAGYDPPAKHKDTQRPNTSKPKVELTGGSVGSTVPAKVTWDGSDVGWGIDHFKLQRSVDGKAWGGTVNTKHRSRSVSLTPGHAYRYRVRAIDKAGHKGTWDVGSTFKVAAIQESANALTWHGAWAVADSASAWGGHSRQSVDADASVSYAFTGRSIAWIAGRDPSFGTAKAYVDGKLAATVNLNGTSSYRKVVWRKTWSSKGTHKVKIVVVGTAGHPTVDVDGFAILR